MKNSAKMGDAKKIETTHEAYLERYGMISSETANEFKTKEITIIYEYETWKKIER